MGKVAEGSKLGNPQTSELVNQGNLIRKPKYINKKDNKMMVPKKQPIKLQQGKITGVRTAYCDGEKWV